MLPIEYRTKNFTKIIIELMENYNITYEDIMKNPKKYKNLFLDIDKELKEEE